MTSEQKPIFDAVILAARNNEPLCQMIEARAGRGKTWLMELIVATARREGIIVLCVASTALAATNYRGGRTSHSQLCIPAGDDPTPGHRVVCNLQLGSQHATFLRAVRLIIWDEVLRPLPGACARAQLGPRTQSLHLVSSVPAF